TPEQVGKLPAFEKLFPPSQARVLFLVRYRRDEDAVARDDEALRAREVRYLQFMRDVRGLRGVNLVASTLVWGQGYPVDGTSALSSYFNERPFKAALWFQAGGDTRGQAWAGPFRDADANGVMELAAPGARLPAGNWSPEVNFLGWQASAGPPR